MSSKASTTKTERELHALRSIYDDRAFHRATPADKPDFILQSTPDSPPFGVEVTELHASEANARVTHLPDYAIELTKDGAVRHKDDRHFVAESVEFTSPDGKKVSGRAFMLDAPALSEYRATVAQIVSRKSEKARDYHAGLSHIDLIILDHAQPFVLADADVANLLVADEGVRSAVMSSAFNEIFVVTRLSPKPAREVVDAYLPLKQLLLAMTPLMFAGAVEKLAPDRSEWPWPDLAAALSDYFYAQGLSSALRDTPFGPELLAGSLGIRIGDDGHIWLHNYTDAPVITGTPVAVDLAAPWRRADFETSFRAYRKEHFVKLSHVFPTRAV
jgi:hypothetical protein